MVRLTWDADGVAYSSRSSMPVPSPIVRAIPFVEGRVSQDRRRLFLIRARGRDTAVNVRDGVLEGSKSIEFAGAAGREAATGSVTSAKATIDSGISS